MEKNRNQSIVKNAILLMVGTIVSKILGFVRELSVAYKFGAGSVSDAFLLTNGIPTLLFSAIAVAISINFIPYYTKLNSKEKRDRFTSNLTNIC